jgi:transposase
MAQAYSNDLRRKFFDAYDEGEQTLEQLAEQFRVSVGWAKKISARRSRTGEVDAPVWRHGSASRVTGAVQEWIRKQIRAQPDMTLQELRQRLEEAQQVRLSMGRTWLALRHLGLRSMRRNRTASKRSSADKSGDNRVHEEPDWNKDLLAIELQDLKGGFVLHRSKARPAKFAKEV